MVLRSVVKKLKSYIVNPIHPSSREDQKRTKREKAMRTVFAEDTPTEKAVVRNSELLAADLGYEQDDPRNTPVTFLHINSGPYGWYAPVDDENSRSATFADAQSVNMDSVEISITPGVIDDMRKYMGTQVMAEAEDPDGPTHAFVEAMLRHYQRGNATLSISRIH